MNDINMPGRSEKMVVDSQNFLIAHIGTFRCCRPINQAECIHITINIPPKYENFNTNKDFLKLRALL